MLTLLPSNSLFFPQMTNLMSEVTRNFNKLIKDLQSQESPEAMAYLRIMGAELGYIRASDLKFMAENAKMYTDIFMRILPTKVPCFVRFLLAAKIVY